MLPLQRGDTYQVRLPVFVGPLDLLLHLIERERLDISTVSLAQITGEFLEYLKQLETVEAPVLADFLVMAARLIYIKSRLLLPAPAAGDSTEQEEDPGEALARQLREYKRFRQAAETLRSLEESGRRSYLRAAGPPQLDRHLVGDLNLADLLAAAHSAFAVQLPRLPAGTVVPPLRLTIHDQIERIARATSGNCPVVFRSLLQQAHTRVEVVVTLLAVLELVKRRQVIAEQSALFGEIVIRPIEGVEITAGGNGTESEFVNGGA